MGAGKVVKRIKQLRKHVAVLVLVAFGLGFIGAGVFAAAQGFIAKDKVQTALVDEKMTIPDRVDPATGEVDEAVPEQWSGKPVNSPASAEVLADIIDHHADDSSGGLTYSELGRFTSAADPEDPAGTSNPDEALVDDNGKPVPNQARNTQKDAAFLRTSLYSSSLAGNLSVLVIGFGAFVTAVGVATLVQARHIYKVS